MPSYTPVTWVDSPATTTPLSAANLNIMEDQIEKLSVAPSSTSLPGTPFDGQEIFYAADATNGIYWHLRYRSASASSYKWEFLGGSALSHEIIPDESVSFINTYQDFATVGPTVTLPLAGDYEVSFGGLLYHSGGNVFAAPKFGSAATSDDDSIETRDDTPGSSLARTMRRTVATAGMVVKVQYRGSNTSASPHASKRWLSIRPVRVG